MKALLSWLDSRTAYRSIIRSALYEHIPGGARWRYVWGSTLVFAFVVQLVTGIFLWMAYSPSSQTAWESVYYIQYEMPYGWLLRGIHHYTAQIMVVLLVLHLLQVVIDGAYRAPREFNFWTGLILLQLMLALGLTGYLLPWDQKGYWATKVATNIMALVPSVGPEIQRLVVGGAEYGHFTLTRFFALHAGVLPALVIALIGLHIFFFRRQGIHARRSAGRADAHFWPDQVLKDSIACLGVLVVVLFLVVYHRLTGGSEATLGASLFAPADPSKPFAAARPDWYFLFLYQFLKYFEGEAEVWGAIYIPAMVLGVMALMPIVGRWRLGHRFNVVFVLALLLGAAVLTGLALVEDAGKEDYQRALAAAEHDAQRVRELAQAPEGIPPGGAVTLLRDDPLTQGPELFARHCASCHRYDGHDGTGRIPEDDPTAADLHGFGSRAWLRGFIDPEGIVSPRYFGGTAFRDGDMARFIDENVSEYDEEEKAELALAIKALSAEASLKAQRAIDATEANDIERGRGLFARRELGCARCHRFHDEGRLGAAPDLTGWGSREWIIGIVSDPAHERFYRDENDRMPAFGRKEILDARSIELVVDWLRDDWFETETDDRGQRAGVGGQRSEVGGQTAETETETYTETEADTDTEAEAGTDTHTEAEADTEDDTDTDTDTEAEADTDTDTEAEAGERNGR